MPWYRRFGALMPFRVREILLISSEYDAFVLEEDGPLTERLFMRYSELNLSAAPRIIHTSTMSEALRLLRERRFDMVMTVLRVEDGDAATLSREVARRHPEIAVVVLVFDEGDLEQLPGGTLPETVDRAFLWSGDAKTLIAAIKLVEDARNVEPDTFSAGVQVILVVEDSVRAYSGLLARLYPELLSQSQSLIADGANPHHRLLRMRARPRVLLANDYEEALALGRRHAEHLLAVITDMRFERDGLEDPRAGVALTQALRNLVPELPVLLVSEETAARAEADELGIGWCAKRSSTLQTELRGFLSLALGFGDFVFKLPDGTEVDRARNVYEMEQALERVTAASVAYHARHHHFSTWLKARGMFDLAAQIRPRSADEFPDVETLRAYLVGVVRRAREMEQAGTISDMEAPPAENRFVRVGGGSIGGKGRGLAFVNSLIARHDLLGRFPDLQIRIPKTVVLGADEFERFTPWTDYEGTVGDADEVHVARALSRPLSPEARAELRFAVSTLRGPLAVRSSSVLEDSRFRPFAGVYATYVLANDHPDPEVRFRQLQDAVRAVYASVFSHSARTYLAGTPHAFEDQRMAVVVQQVVGVRYGTRFYPVLSGVAQSWNHYPTGGQRPEEGIAHIALGLGQQVVGGGAAVQFSPGSPTIRPQFASDRELARSTQTKFYAVDLTQDQVDLVSNPRSALVELPLDAAAEDGVLRHVASRYDPNDDVVRDSPTAAGMPVVTFHNVLRYHSFPLAKAIRMLLEMLRDAVGGEVEMELAVDAPGVLPDGTTRAPRLYVVQLRPLPPWTHRASGHAMDTLPEGHRLLLCDRALGDGVLDAIRDVVYVRRDDLGMKDAKRAAEEVRSVLADLDRPYALIGPGRWGTSDPNLGIPIRWRDLSGVRMIVETPLAGRHVEPSQGSHFFRNLVTERIAYLSLGGPHDVYDRAYLDRQDALRETELVRHVRFDEPLYGVVDGRRGSAVVLAMD
ncbi:MAG: hypothetical protein KC619_06675 [Myxococcales bacterium]|nr:hypothetical protein [Myxococcales bacterium]